MKEKLSKTAISFPIASSINQKILSKYHLPTSSCLWNSEIDSKDSTFASKSYRFSMDNRYFCGQASKQINPNIDYSSVDPKAHKMPDVVPNVCWYPEYSHKKNKQFGAAFAWKTERFRGISIQTYILEFSDITSWSFFNSVKLPSILKPRPRKLKKTKKFLSRTCICFTG